MSPSGIMTPIGVLLPICYIKELWATTLTIDLVGAIFEKTLEKKKDAKERIHPMLLLIYSDIATRKYTMFLPLPKFLVMSCILLRLLTNLESSWMHEFDGDQLHIDCLNISIITRYVMLYRARRGAIRATMMWQSMRMLTWDACMDIDLYHHGFMQYILFEHNFVQ